MNSGCNFKTFTDKTKAVARFSESDLLVIKTKDLHLLSVSSSLVNLPLDIINFKEKFGIRGILNQSEVAIVGEHKAKRAAKELVTSDDVHGFINNKFDNYYSPRGLVYTDTTAAVVVEKVLKPSVWIMPSDLYSNYPGLEIIVGFSLAFLQKNKEGRLEVFTDGDKLYQQVPFGGLAPSTAPIFAQVIIDQIGNKFEQSTSGNGRAFISELLSAFSSMTKIEYLVMQKQLALGPLHPCFVWGVATPTSVVQREYDPKRQDVNWVPIGIKTAFTASFINCGASETVKHLEQGFGHTFGGFFPIMVKALPMKFNPPVLKSMPETKAFMELCRTQRHADEKCLSAWSSGFCSTGNPTKLQNRIQKKMSLILGSLLAAGKNTTTIIEDDSSSDVEILYNLVLKWIEKSQNLQEKRFKFCLRATDLAYHKLKADHRITSYESFTHARILILSNTTYSSVKAVEWVKVDKEVMDKIRVLMPRKSTQRKELDVQYTVMTHIMSEELFDTKIMSDSQSKPEYFVYGLGSIHNMYGIVSTMDQLPLAKSDGSTMWNLSLDLKKPIDKSTFFKAVGQHNLGRSGFMLYPKYFFNPNLNFLRRLNNKTINFETGQLEEFGVDVEVGMNSLGLLAEPDPGSPPVDSKTVTVPTPVAVHPISASGSNSSNVVAAVSSVPEGSYDGVKTVELFDFS
jgi:hypothetical protein